MIGVLFKPLKEGISGNNATVSKTAYQAFHQEGSQKSSAQLETAIQISTKSIGVALSWFLAFSLSIKRYT